VTEGILCRECLKRMNPQNESSTESTTENINSTKLDPNTPEILESKREKNSKEHVSNPSRLDIEGYIFKDSKLIKKKKKIYTDVYGVDSDSIVVKSNTTNHYKKHKSKKHHHHSKHRKMKTWKKVLLSIGCTLLGLIIIAVGTVAYLIYQGGNELFNSDIHVSAPQGIETEENGKYVIYNGETYKFNDKVTNILCMGVDKRDLDQDNNSKVKASGGQADVLMLVSIDTSNGKITLFNISRDTMIDVTMYSAGGAYAGTENQQICLSYAYGDGKESSCENTVNSVQRLFYNIPINTYFSLDLDGIAALNDSVGGVDVVSPETIGDFVEGQSYHLVGQQAESFVRTRDTSKVDSNNMRMQRQKVYIQSFMNTVLQQTKKDLTTPLDLFNASAPYSCTNLNPSKVTYLAQQAVLGGMSGIDMMSVPGQIKMGKKYAEFNVSEAEFYQMFLNVYYTKMG
jgi:LCP family protein required for cell wall assembly